MRAGAGLLTGALVTVLVLSLVPVPRGPATLTLPAFIDEARLVDAPGVLARTDGSITERGDPGDGTRDGLDGLGGYPGFAESLDTSIRGDFADEVVMRVRATEPDFWRGQTFGEFDGRFWYADSDLGRPADGPCDRRAARGGRFEFDVGAVQPVRPDVLRRGRPAQRSVRRLPADGA